MSIPTQVLFDAPGPVARLRHRIVALVALLVLAAGLAWVIVTFAAKGQLTAQKWGPFLTGEIWVDYLLPGILGTLVAAAISVLLACALGFVLGVGRLSEHLPVRAVAGVVTEFFRSVPVLMMMLFAFALYARYNLFPAQLLALAGVVTGLMFYNGAVIAELLRSGVKALPAGQSEAGLSIGLPPVRVLRTILVPQAVTSMLPSLVSQLVVVLKDTALGYVITYEELLKKVDQIGNYKGNLIPAFLVVAAIYILINYSVSVLASRVEARMRRSTRSTGNPAAALLAAGGTAGVGGPLADEQLAATRDRS